ncbi:MAG TPA: hypothetical protein VL769_03630 [Acidimicrobiia bacterium]|nr:hypothetical protein [Acidimicrobiia bacterium]
MTTIVVAGALANKTGSGGEAWVRISWATGLAALGADVHLVEAIDTESCVDGSGAPCDVEQSANLAFFRHVTGSLGVAATLLASDGRTFGAPRTELRDLAAAADLLVNISGHLRSPDLLGRFRRKAYVDIDPGFTQLWHDAGMSDVGLADHDVHFTIGENVGSAECNLPCGGIQWIPTRQPVDLDDWPLVAPGRTDRLTTVASWRGAYGPVEHRGHTLGVKAHEFRKYLELPGRVEQRLELALDIHPADEADRRRLIDHGWQLVDPRRNAATPEQFRSYVQSSSGEFSVAQEVYVATRSGWFSDRTVRYLASGRPALVQDTGFSRHLPVGRGLVAFSSMEEAALGAKSIESDYSQHASAARAIAERYFDANVVLPRFLEQAGVRA